MQVQWVDRADFNDKAESQKLTYETIPARPGEIVDRDGHVLAMTISCSSLFLNPSRVEEPSEVAAQIGGVLGLDPKKIESRLLANSQQQFIWVKRRLTDEQAAGIRDLELPDDCWGFREEYRRRFPQGVLAAHVLGTRDIDGVGQGGLEQTLQSVLLGTDGSRALIRDARGAVIEVNREKTTPPQHGKSVSLTIDSIVQLHTERELDRVVEEWKPSGACAIVMDPHTGEILAMASRPTFDPNHPARKTREPGRT